MLCEVTRFILNISNAGARGGPIAGPCTTRCAQSPFSTIISMDASAIAAREARKAKILSRSADRLALLKGETDHLPKDAAPAPPSLDDLLETCGQEVFDGEQCSKSTSVQDNVPQNRRAPSSVAPPSFAHLVPEQAELQAATSPVSSSTLRYRGAAGDASTLADAGASIIAAAPTPSTPNPLDTQNAREHSLVVAAQRKRAYERWKGRIAVLHLAVIVCSALGAAFTVALCSSGGIQDSSFISPQELARQKLSSSLSDMFPPTQSGVEDEGEATMLPAWCTPATSLPLALLLLVAIRLLALGPLEKIVLPALFPDQQPVVAPKPTVASTPSTSSSTHSSSQRSTVGGVGAVPPPPTPPHLHHSLASSTSMDGSQAQQPDMAALIAAMLGNASGGGGAGLGLGGSAATPSMSTLARLWGWGQKVLPIARFGYSLLHDYTLFAFCVVVGHEAFRAAGVHLRPSE